MTIDAVHLIPTVHVSHPAASGSRCANLMAAHTLLRKSDHIVRLAAVRVVAGRTGHVFAHQKTFTCAEQPILVAMHIERSCRVADGGGSFVFVELVADHIGKR